MICLRLIKMFLLTICGVGFSACALIITYLRFSKRFFSEVFPKKALVWPFQTWRRHCHSCVEKLSCVLSCVEIEQNSEQCFHLSFCICTQWGKVDSIGELPNREFVILTKTKTRLRLRFNTRKVTRPRVFGPVKLIKCQCNKYTEICAFSHMLQSK